MPHMATHCQQKRNSISCVFFSLHSKYHIFLPFLALKNHIFWLFSSICLRFDSLLSDGMFWVKGCQSWEIGWKCRWAKRQNCWKICLFRCVCVYVYWLPNQIKNWFVIRFWFGWAYNDSFNRIEVDICVSRNQTIFFRLKKHVHRIF